MTLRGIDISSYQPSTYDTSGLTFVFTKATEGTSYTNPRMAAQAATARSAGLVVGFYHFLHPGSIQQQAQYFVSQAASRPGDILACDWEPTSSGLASVAEKDQFIRAVKALRPDHKVILYCDVDRWTNVDTTSYAGDGLWIADYVTPGQPRIKSPWTIHQYSDAAPQGGDADLANPALFADSAAFRSWAAGTQPTPAPAPTPAPVPTPSETDMPAWISGTVVPGTQPTVALSPHGSAWKTAANRRLHLGMDQFSATPAKASVRVAIHNGTAWRISTVSLTAADGTVDVPMTADDVKVSLQTTDAGVAYAIEAW